MINKLNKLGYTKIDVLIVVVLLGVVAFITINKTSYAFEIDNKKAITEYINLIELQAEDYARDNLNLFKETDTTYISVDDLVDNKYLIGNEDGLITDPTDNTKVYNSNKIKLEYNKEKNSVKATFVN